MHTGRITLAAAIPLGGHRRVLAQSPHAFSGAWKTPSDVVPGLPVLAPGHTGAGAKGKSTITIQ